jgi:hypothetical protein
MTARDVIDLPEPDSPTMPMVRLRSTVNDTSFTTSTGPREVGNVTVRCSTSRSALTAVLASPRAAMRL